MPSPASIGGAAVVEEALDGLVDVEAFRRHGDALGDELQPVEVDAGLAAAVVVGEILRRLEAGPAAVEPVGLVGEIGLAGLELGLEALAPVGAQLVDFALGDDAFVDQLLGVDLQRRRMGADRRVHQRLGEGRLVALVVAEAAVAEHVDDHRLVELLPVFGGDLGGVHHRLGVVAVGVEDRRLDQLGDVGRIGRGARVARVGGEADLVVDDEMDRAAGAVALQPRQAEALGDHALAGEGRVAVDQQRQHLGRARCSRRS